MTYDEAPSLLSHTFGSEGWSSVVQWGLKLSGCSEPTGICFVVLLGIMTEAGSASETRCVPILIKIFIFFHGTTAPRRPESHYRGSRHTTLGMTPLVDWSVHPEISIWQHNTYKRQISLPPAGFKPPIPASKRPQTHALDRAATDIGPVFISWVNYYRKQCLVNAHCKYSFDSGHCTRQFLHNECYFLIYICVYIYINK